MIGGVQDVAEGIWRCAGCGQAIASNAEVLEFTEGQSGHLDEVGPRFDVWYYAHPGHDAPDRVANHIYTGRGSLGELRESRKGPLFRPRDAS